MLDNELIRVIKSPDDYRKEVDHLVSINMPLSIGFMNQHAFNLVNEDKETYSFFRSLDYLYRDGIGIKIALSLYGKNPGLNMNGTDLIPIICESFMSKYSEGTIFCLGTQEPWLSDGANSLMRGASVNCLDGFKKDFEYLDFIEKNLTDNQPALIVLAMGMPKQERIAKKLKETLSGSVLIICGGAILDFAAGRVQRAPEWMRNLGLEWLYRLGNEPTRLFKRYVIGIPKFFVYVFLLKRRNKSV